MLYHTVKTIKDDMKCSRQWVWKVINQNKEILDDPGVIRKKPFCCDTETANKLKKIMEEKKERGPGRG